MSLTVLLAAVSWRVYYSRATQLRWAWEATHPQQTSGASQASDATPDGLAGMASELWGGR